jgi:hypothetical protein
MPPTCAQTIYPVAVIASVTEQMNAELTTLKDEIPSTMQVQPSVRRADLLDSLMIEVSFRPKIEEGPTAISSDTSWKEVTVQESDVLRGEEMIRRHTGAVGTIVFVVRRPG